MRFLLFVFRTFFGYWRVAWRRHRGILPDRTGPRDHEFTIDVRGPDGLNTLTMKGACSLGEVSRLTGFLSVYEEPLFGVALRDGMMIRVPDGPVPTITGVVSDLRLEGSS